MKPEVLRASLEALRPREEPSDGAVQAGVSILIAPGPELLLIRRARHPKDPWSGQIGLPGGTLEIEDADLLETAVRETREEIAVNLPPDAMLGRLDDFRPQSGGIPDVLIRPFVFSLSEKPETNCSDEVQYCLWTPVRELAASRCVRIVRVGGADRKVEAYLAGDDEVVWGITYRILSGFFAALDLR